MLILRNLLRIFSYLLPLAAAHAQGRDDKSYAFSKIKKSYRQINNDKQYKIVTIDDAEEFLGHGSDHGASLKGYYKGDTLKKMVEWVGLSNKVIQREYYLDSNQLIFVYCKESTYGINDSTQNFDFGKLDHVFQGRYYFYKGKLLETILGDKERNKTKQSDAALFIELARDYLKLLKGKIKTK